ncbi:MAG: 3'(2'), 5'-bisphosphate nucleotidase [Chlamydiales bacterium]|jgi:3'(2'), 5'-bisphosphate nucleotidase
MIDEIKAIALAAGKEIMAVYKSDDFSVEIKADKSPLTRADTRANTCIIEGLREVSSFPILTEESFIDFVDRKDWKTFWLVDPLDGTKDFIAKNSEFTVNIALIENHRPVMGVIYQPACDIMYWAEKDKGAYKDGTRIENRSERTDLIAATSRFHETEETLAFLSKHSISNFQSYGSSLKLCKLAEGSVDVYPRMVGSSEWDIAAGDIIATEALCKVIAVTTQEELLYGKENIRNPFFVASRKELFLL